MILQVLGHLGSAKSTAAKSLLLNPSLEWDFLKEKTLGTHFLLTCRGTNSLKSPIPKGRGLQELPIPHLPAALRKINHFQLESAHSQTWTWEIFELKILIFISLFPFFNPQINISHTSRSKSLLKQWGQCRYSNIYLPKNKFQAVLAAGIATQIWHTLNLKTSSGGWKFNPWGMITTINK